MRIAFLVSSFPAISETFVLNQITGLLDRGHEVEIFAKRPRKESAVHRDVLAYDLLRRTHYVGIPATLPVRLAKGMALLAKGLPQAPLTYLRSLDIRKYKRRAASLDLLYMVAPFLQGEAHDILHCHFGPNGELGIMLKSLGLAKRVVVTFHGYDVSRYVKKKRPGVYRRLFAEADLMMPVSDLWRERLFKVGAPPENVVVHRMGIDLQQLCFQERSRPGSGPVRLLTVGRLTEKKGIEYAVRAVASLRHVCELESVRYDIVGDGRLRAELERLVNELGLEKTVTLHGAQPHDVVRELMQESHVFLLPSVTAADGDMEGIPVVLMEALASGLPVISTVHSGIPELIEDGVSGFLVAERDAEALAERVGYLLTHSDTWSEMGRAGRKYVEQHYDIGKLNDRLVEMYAKVVGSGKLHA